MDNALLDPNAVPREAVPLIPLAERWGIGDDFEREKAVVNASDNELKVLAWCFESVDEKPIFDWLAGDESHNSKPTKEYLAFTCLTMAMYSAKTQLKKRGGAHHSLPDGNQG
jgi:hypothetical protein